MLTQDGKTGFGFSFRLDAAEARHMAEWHAGARTERPPLDPVLDHPWEKAFLEGKPIPWDCEPGFASPHVAVRLENRVPPPIVAACVGALMLAAAWTLPMLEC